MTLPLEFLTEDELLAEFHKAGIFTEDEERERALMKQSAVNHALQNALLGQQHLQAQLRNQALASQRHYIAGAIGGGLLPGIKLW